MFRWKITRDTAVTVVAGLVMILLSLLMLPFDGESTLCKFMNVILRDVLMIFGLGFCFVTLYCRKHGSKIYGEMGFHKDKWKASLLLNIILGIALLHMFLKEKTPEHLLCIENFYGAIYIVTAGIFEMLFIYGFLRRGFERSFGTIPAILLTSVFYSFHHAGFQPEFLHLFLVGIMYVSVFYITKNMLVIFPFFWGVGALWDVLVDSSSGNSIKNPFSFFVALGIILGIVIWYCYLKKRNGERYAVKDVNCDHGNLIR